MNNGNDQISESSSLRSIHSDEIIDDSLEIDEGARAYLIKGSIKEPERSEAISFKD